MNLIRVVIFLLFCLPFAGCKKQPSEPESPKSEFEELEDSKQLTLAQEFSLFITENKNIALSFSHCLLAGNEKGNEKGVRTIYNEKEF